MVHKLLHALFPLLCATSLFWLVAHFWMMFTGNYLYCFVAFILLLLTNLALLLVNHALMGDDVKKPADDSPGMP
ncbi:hypothetical protein GCM10028805_52280 [Spirosoma harenae]